MVQSSLEVLYFHFLWKTTKLLPEEATPPSLIELRTHLIDRTTDLALGRLNSASEGVKRGVSFQLTNSEPLLNLKSLFQAFKTLLDLRIVSKARYSVTENLDDHVEFSVESQYRCAGFVQAELERYAAGLAEQTGEPEALVHETAEDDLEEDGADDEMRPLKAHGNKGKKTPNIEEREHAGKGKYAAAGH